MTMSFIRGCCLLVVLAGFPGWAQEDLSLLLQPSISLNYKVSGSYAHNFSIAQRLSYLNLGEETLSVRNVDLSHFSNLKLGVHPSVGIGVLYRFREAFEGENTNELRITEQFNYVTRNHSLRFGHRVRTEQRIFPSQTLHRFRYRFAGDGPLQGIKLDWWPGRPAHGREGDRTGILLQDQRLARLPGQFRH